MAKDKNIEKQIEIIENESASLNNNLGKSESLLGKMCNKLVDVKDNIVTISETIAGGGLVVSLAQAAKNSWDLNNSMTALSMQMGKGAEGIKQLQGSVTGMMKDIGSSYQDATDIVKSLAEMKYQGDMSEAAKSVDMFSRATSVGVSTTLQLTEALNKQAGLSTKSTTAILAGMTAVQQKVGISKKGMEALSEHIIDVANNMSAFGKSSEDIKRMAVNTTALVGAMEKVGVAAETTLGIVDRLTDPERLEDNILLYSQLGISMEDALSGNVEITDGMLQQLGTRIKEMGPIAGSAFAQSMGLHYKDLVKMSKATEDISSKVADEANIKEDEALDKLQGMMNQAEGFGKKVSNFFNKVQGFIMGLGPIVLTLLALITGSFGKKLSSVKTDTNKMIKGVGESANAVIEKTTDKLSKRLQTSFSGVKNWEDFKGGVRDFTGGRKGIIGNAANKYFESGQQIRSDALKDRNEFYLSGIMENQSRIDSGASEREAVSLRKEIELYKEKLNLQGRDTEDIINYKNNREIIVQELNKEVAEEQRLLGLIGKANKSINSNGDLIKKEGSLRMEIRKLERETTNGSLKDNKAAKEKLETLKLQEFELNDQLKAIQRNIDAANKEKSKFEGINDEIDEANKKMNDPKSSFGAFIKGTGGRISGKFNTWKTGLENDRRKSGKATTGLMGVLGLGKDMGKDVAKKALTSTAGKASIIGLVVTEAVGLMKDMVGKFLPKLAEGITQINSSIKDKVVKALEPMVAPLLGIFNTLVRILVPPLLYFLSASMAVQGVIQMTLGGILKLFSFGHFGKNTYNLGKSLITETTPALWKAGNDILFNRKNEEEKDSKDKQTDAINANTDALNGNAKPVMDARGGQAWFVSGTQNQATPENGTQTYASVGNPTQSVVIKEDENKKNEKSNNQREEKNYKEEIKKQLQTSSDNGSVLIKLLEDILDQIKGVLEFKQKEPVDVTEPNFRS